MTLIMILLLLAGLNGNMCRQLASIYGAPSSFHPIVLSSSCLSRPGDLSDESLLSIISIAPVKSDTNNNFIIMIGFNQPVPDYYPRTRREITTAKEMTGYWKKLARSHHEKNRLWNEYFRNLILESSLGNFSLRENSKIPTDRWIGGHRIFNSGFHFHPHKILQTGAPY